MSIKIYYVASDIFQFVSEIEMGSPSNKVPKSLHESTQYQEAFKRIVLIHGIGPYLGWKIKDKKLCLNLPKSIEDFLILQYRENKKRFVYMAELQSSISKCFSENKIEYFFFKGFSISDVFYENKFIRPMADLDVFVNNSCVDITSIIEKFGFTYNSYENTGVSFRKDPLPEFCNTDQLIDGLNQPVGIDIHYNMSLNRFFTNYNLDDIFYKLTTEDNPNSLMDHYFVYILTHCAKHLISQSGRWIQLYDIYRIIKSDHINFKKVTEIAYAYNVEHLIYLPLTMTSQLFKSEKTLTECFLERELPSRFTKSQKKFNLSTYSYCNPYELQTLRKLGICKTPNHFISHLLELIWSKITYNEESKRNGVASRGLVGPVSRSLQLVEHKFWSIFQEIGLTAEDNWM